MNDLRYPIGKFKLESTITEELRLKWIEEIAETPAQLRASVEGLIPDQLNTPYRPNGWTVRQVVHHVPDSHLNSYVRFKLALTEDEPTIKAYYEDRWAQLQDSTITPIESSLTMLDMLHQRWVILLRSMTAEQWSRTFRHPEVGILTLDTTLGLYAWHGKHHVAHITSLRDRMGWN